MEDTKKWQDWFNVCRERLKDLISSLEELDTLIRLKTDKELKTLDDGGGSNPPVPPTPPKPPGEA
jgi:hypothetical protein